MEQLNPRRLLGLFKKCGRTSTLTPRLKGGGQGINGWRIQSNGKGDKVHE
jgi:hypothetical protein